MKSELLPLLFVTPRSFVSLSGPDLGGLWALRGVWVCGCCASFCSLAAPLFPCPPSTYRPALPAALPIRPAFALPSPSKIIYNSCDMGGLWLGAATQQAVIIFRSRKVPRYAKVDPIIYVSLLGNPMHRMQLICQKGYTISRFYGIADNLSPTRPSPTPPPTIPKTSGKERFKYPNPNAIVEINKSVVQSFENRKMPVCCRHTRFLHYGGT